MSEKTKLYKTSDSLTRNAGRGAIWTIAAGGWHLVVRLGASCVLARFLTPSEFGLFGMAILGFTLIQKIGTMGLNAGIIVKKNESEADISTCFWIQVCVQIFLFLICFSSAPLAGSFFNTPEVVNIYRAISFVFLLSIPGAIPRALLQKRLQFKKLSIIQGAGIFCESGLAVLLVVGAGMGYWALVISMIFSTAVTQSLLFCYSKWWPRFIFNRESFKYLLKFGLNLQGVAILNYFQSNIDYLVVGRVLGAGNLGLYEFAYRIPYIVHSKFVSPMAQVFLPILANVKHSDERLGAGFLKASKNIAFIAFPLLGMLFVVAHPLVLLLWGKQWLASVEPMKILCLSGALICTMTPLAPVFLCKKRPDILLKFNVVQLIITFFAVWFLGKYYGLTGVAAGMLISIFPWFFLLRYAFKMLKLPMKLFFKKMSGPFVSTILAVMLAQLGQTLLEKVSSPDILNIVIPLVIGSVVYLLSILFIFKNEAKEMKQLLTTIMSK